MKSNKIYTWAYAEAIVEYCEGKPSRFYKLHDITDDEKDDKRLCSFIAFKTLNELVIRGILTAVDAEFLLSSFPIEHITEYYG